MSPALVWTRPRTHEQRGRRTTRGAARLEELETELADLRFWGTSAYGPAFASEQASHGNRIPEVEAALFAKASRNACTPDVAIELARMWAETDVRGILPSIAVPSLILAQTAIGEVDRARQIAAQISGAEFREIEGDAWTVPMVMTARRGDPALRRR